MFVAVKHVKKMRLLETTRARGFFLYLIVVNQFSLLPGHKLHKKMFQGPLLEKSEMLEWQDIWHNIWQS